MRVFFLPSTNNSQIRLLTFPGGETSQYQTTRLDHHLKYPAAPATTTILATVTRPSAPTSTKQVRNCSNRKGGRDIPITSQKVGCKRGIAPTERTGGNPQSAECMGVAFRAMCSHAPDFYSPSTLPASPPFCPGGGGGGHLQVAFALFCASIDGPYCGDALLKPFVPGWCETVRTWEAPMRGLFPLSLASGVLYDPGLSSGARCSPL